MTSTLSLAEIKELIAYAREQKIAHLEVATLKFQFHMSAFIDAKPEENKPKAAPTPEAPFGHFVPE